MAKSAGAIRAGKAFIELFADDGPLQRGLGKAQTTLKTWGEKVSKVGLKLGAAGSAVTAPLLAAAKQFASSGAQISDIAKRTGASTDALQSLGFAAKQTGSDVGAVEGAIAHIGQQLIAAARG